MKVYAVHIEGNIDYFYKLIHFVDQKKKIRIESYYHNMDKYRCLIGDILIRYILSHYLNSSLDKICFKYNSYGKPFLENDDAYFSLSHSGKWVVACIDPNENGIDIQKIGKVDLGIAQRFFLQKEYKELIAKEVNERAELFYELWTLKETYIKTVGKGLSIPLDSFLIKKVENGTYKSMVGYKEMFLKVLDIDPQYKMCLGSYNKIFTDQDSIIILSPKQLYKLFLNSINR